MASEKLNIIIKAKDQASANIGKVGGSITKLKKLAVAGGIALAAMAAVTFTKAIKEFSGFEKTMSKVKAIARPTEEGFIRLEKVAKDLGKSTVFSAKESAEAMTFLGMAGLDTQEIVAALPGTLDLAAASNIGLGRAADISTNVMSGFGLKAKDMGEVVDILARTTTSANVTAEEFGESMKFLGPTATALGISLEESAALVGIFGDSGLKGGIATRAFGASLIGLADPTNKAAAGMRAANLEAFDQQGKFVGLKSIVQQLEEGMEGMADKQKLATVAAIFGKDAVKQMNILLLEGSEALGDYTTELENSGGAAREMAETQLDNLAGSFTLLKSAVSGFLIDAGGPFAESFIRPAIDGMTVLVGVVSSFIEENLPIWIENIKTFVDDNDELWNTYKKIIVFAFEEVMDIVKAAWPVVKGFFTLTMAAIKLLKEVWTADWGIIGDVLGFIWDNMKLKIEFVLGLIAESMKFWTSVFKGDWSGAWEAIKNIAVDTINFVIDKINLAIALLNKLSFGLLDLGPISNVGPQVTQSFIGPALDIGPRQPTRAFGGSVTSGRPFTVGENGPETFTPSSKGTISPGGGLGGINITINGDVSGEEIAEKIGDIIIGKLKMHSSIVGI